KVNYRLVPLSHILTSGDQIEVITSNKQKPSEDWLHCLITAKAKSRVKYYLKEEKRKIAEDGKAMLQRKLSTMGATMQQHNINELTAYFKKPSPLDLYYAIAVGSIDLKDLQGFTVHGNKIMQPVHEVKLDTRNLVSEEEIDRHKAKPSELIIFGE